MRTAELAGPPPIGWNGQKRGGGQNGTSDKLLLLTQISTAPSGGRCICVHFIRHSSPLELPQVLAGLPWLEMSETTEGEGRAQEDEEGQEEADEEEDLHT